MSSIRSFIPLEKLGEGTYSNVYKVRRVDDNEIYALKKVKLNSLTQKEKENALNEVRILASIESPNIIAYKEAFFDESLNVLCVVMEFADDGDLHKLIKTHTKGFKLIQEQEIWRAAEHILKGLQNLHFRGILHRDIKCANIFKSKGVYKLGDLNVSKVNGDKLAYTQTGTPYYASPEVWRDEPYDSKSDIWSFGCIIYEMATLKPPFNGRDMEDLFKNVQKAKVPPLTHHYSSQLWEFIQLSLQKEPKKRPTAGELLKYIKKNNQNSTNGIKINNPETNQLLKTIKVPNDLKKLNEALPTSKYKKGNEPVENKTKQMMLKKLMENQVFPNKSSVVIPTQSKLMAMDKAKKESSVLMEDVHSIESKQTVYRMGKVGVQTRENKSAVYSQNDRLQTPKNMVHDLVEDSYRSPKGKVETNRLHKSPASEVRLGKKVENGMGYSERLQKSDRKPATASKVERLRYEMEIDIKNLAEQLKKPISMPRTEKKGSIINNSHLIESSCGNEYQGSNKKMISEQGYMGNYHSSHVNGHIVMSKKYDGGDLRNKLLKKNRIMSSNQSKPSWW